MFGEGRSLFAKYVLIQFVCFTMSKTNTQDNFFVKESKVFNVLRLRAFVPAIERRAPQASSGSFVVRDINLCFGCMNTRSRGLMEVA